MWTGYRGYRPDLEQLALLEHFQCGLHPSIASGAFEPPPVINHRPWLKIKNQGETNSCIGHALATGAQVDLYLATEGNTTDVELSAWYLYLTAQIESGTYGQDEGGTMFGSSVAAHKKGFCREQLLPRPRVYNKLIPAEAEREGVAHRANRQFTLLHGYVDVFRYVASCMGPVLFAGPVTEEYQQCRGVLNGMRGRLLGLHAQVIVGFTSRRDPQGNPYLDSPGSWGTQFADNGWVEYQPALFDSILQDKRSIAMGISGVPPFQAPEHRLAWLLRHGVFA